MGVAFVGVFPHEHAQCAMWIDYRISSCNLLRTGRSLWGRYLLLAWP